MVEKSGMECVFTDGSYKCGYGGIAAIAPSWLLRLDGFYRRCRSLQVEAQSGLQGYAAFYGACRCTSSNDTEKKALSVAFLLAADMLRSRPDLVKRVAIVTDSMVAMQWVMSDGSLGDHLIAAMHHLWADDPWIARRITLTKVKGHRFHVGNEFADRWANIARCRNGVAGWSADGSSFYRF